MNPIESNAQVPRQTADLDPNIRFSNPTGSDDREPARGGFSDRYEKSASGKTSCGKLLGAQTPTANCCLIRSQGLVMAKTLITVVKSAQIPRRFQFKESGLPQWPLFGEAKTYKVLVESCESVEQQKVGLTYLACSDSRL